MTHFIIFQKQSIKEDKPDEYIEPVPVEKTKPEVFAVEPEEPARVPDSRPPSVASGRALTPDYKRPDTPPRPPSVPGKYAFKANC